jgi:thymidylate synthase (FAD)
MQNNGYEEQNQSKAKIEEIIGKEFPVLDHGFVRLVDLMGDDSSICQAARVSYGKGTKTVREDRTLLRYLMRHLHTSPFEMVELKFHIRLPIFIARQWIRHRTANVNEYSGRYSEMTDEFYIPELSQIRTQSEVNKQARSEVEFDITKAEEITSNMRKSQEDSYSEYKSYVDEGVAREIARINLPLSSYTEWYWKIDLHNLFHFLKLRLDHHAQYEIRVYAEVIANILKQILPMSYEAFEDYILNSVTFSSAELSLLKTNFANINFDEMIIDDSDFPKLELIELKRKINFITSK